MTEHEIDQFQAAVIRGVTDCLIQLDKLTDTIDRINTTGATK